MVFCSANNITPSDHVKYLQQNNIHCRLFIPFSFPQIIVPCCLNPPPYAQHFDHEICC